MANTGYESVDIIDLATKRIERIDLLGESLRKNRPEYQQYQDSKPHLHHISSITIDDEEEHYSGYGKATKNSEFDKVGMDRK